MSVRFDDRSLSSSVSPVRAWFLAVRPRTLSVSFVPVMVGTSLAAASGAKVNWLLALFALLCSLSIQIGTNLINDALDFKKGADEERRWGSLRVTQSGLLSFKEVFRAGCLCFALSLLFGIPLIFAGGISLGVALLLSVASGYLYTGGPYPLAYLGGGDVFILIFFGWVATCSLYYLQTGGITIASLIAGTQLGLLAIVPHAINNLRDRLSDASAHKKTLAVRFGDRFVLAEIIFCSFLPFFGSIYWIENGFLWAGVLPFLAFLPVFQNVKSICLTPPGIEYNRFLAKSAFCQLLFALLLSIGFFLK